MVMAVITDGCDGWDEGNVIGVRSSYGLTVLRSDTMI